MFSLAGPTLPDSSETLGAALRGGFAAQEIQVKNVTAHGVWPALDSLEIDLTGARISRSHRVLAPTEARTVAFTAGRFELFARPAEFESVLLQASLCADDAGFEFSADANGDSMLLLSRATQGGVTAEVTRADFERLIHSLASEAAREHGVEIKRTSVTFTSRGPRAVSVIADVTAKMFIASATVTLSGDLDLDEQMVARLTNLRLTGDGMVANLAGSFIRPLLARFEGQEFPLLSFALGDIRLRDVEFQGGDTLRFSARFGS